MSSYEQQHADAMKEARSIASKTCKGLAAALRRAEKAPLRARGQAINAVKEELVQQKLPPVFFYSLRAFNLGNRTLESVADELLEHVARRDGALK